MNFIHDDPEFDDLLQIVAMGRGFSRGIIEKDYWVTHALWSLHQLRQAHAAIEPMFWGPRVSLEDACAKMRDWTRSTFNQS